MRKDMGVPAAPSGCQPTASAADASSRGGIPNAADLWAQLHYPEAVEALAESIGPLIVEEFDCEPRGVEWCTISETDKITIRFIAKAGIDRLKNHCHGNARSAKARDQLVAQAQELGMGYDAPACDHDWLDTYIHDGHYPDGRKCSKCGTFAAVNDAFLKPDGRTG